MERLLIAFVFFSGTCKTKTNWIATNDLTEVEMWNWNESIKELIYLAQMKLQEWNASLSLTNWNANLWKQEMSMVLLQNENEINYLAEGESRKIEEKQQLLILWRFPGNGAKKMVGSSIVAIMLQLLELPSLILSTW